MNHLQSLAPSSHGARVPKSPYQTAAKQKRLTYRKSTRRLPRGLRQEREAGAARGAEGSCRRGRGREPAPWTRVPGEAPTDCGSGFSSRAGSPALPQGRVAGALFPASGRAGVSLSKGIYLWEKGATRRGWGWWATSVYAGGQRGR